MRAVAIAIAAVLAQACFPDPEDLRTKSAPAVGGNAGGAGGSAGAGGSTAGAGGTGGATAGAGGAGGVTAGAGGAGGAITPARDGGVGPAADAAAPTESRDNACAVLARALAGAAARCSPFLLGLQYGNQATYEQRLLLNCQRLDVPGSNWPPRPSATCAAALTAIACDDWYEGRTPAACAAPGNLADGASCTAGDQCRSMMCDFSGGGACGRCARLPGVGQPCVEGAYCAEGLTCNGAGTCTMPGGLRAACSVTQPCRPALACLGGTCQARQGAGAPCLDDSHCNVLGGVACNADIGQCVNVTLSPSACRGNPDGSFVLCAGSARCVGGGCIPPAAMGGACADDGATCMWPHFCGADRTCQLPRLDRTCGPAAARREPAPLSDALGSWQRLRWSGGRRAAP